MKAAEQFVTLPTTNASIQPDAARRLSLAGALASHWVEYAIEATLIALFMVSASFFGVALEHPSSPIRATIESGLLRRAIMGVAMGLSAVALIYSPIGKRSGAHYNPSVTLTFLRLGKVPAPDAFFYVVAQIIGGILGVSIAAVLLRDLLAAPTVHFVTTVPGRAGLGGAFVAELVISFVLMSTVLAFVSRPEITRFAGLAAGTLVALFITFEAPLSGMSMNFARTFGSAVLAREWNGLWIYIIAPLLGMLTASEIHVRLGRAAQHCAKLHHDNSYRCIFCGANGGSSNE